MIKKPLYDINKSYDFNYEFGPFFKGSFPAKLKKRKKSSFLGFKVNSLFGIPAGPLLNSRWVKTYADLGFDILTYKTVRTASKTCYQAPNIVYIKPLKKTNYNLDVPLYQSQRKNISYLKISITNSFGVPSKEADVWQLDVKRLLSMLSNGQLLILSIMGTASENISEKEYINDFVKCACLAKQTGVKIIEVNLSCPNLGAGAIYNNIDLSKKIVEKIKKAVKPTPILAKIGYFQDINLLKKFVLKTYSFIDGYAAINTISKKVIQLNGRPALPGKSRLISGICGAMIKNAGLSMVKALNKIRNEKKLKYKIIGIGGVLTPKDYFDYLNSGADAVQSATGAMWNPYLAYQIKKAKIND